MQHQVSFPVSAPYYTLNEVTKDTRYIWIGCHGYGQLAQFFLKKFESLDPRQHFFIAPQGLSRFYLDNTYGRVGASWMTKEDREMDLANQKAYFDAVFDPLFENIDFDHYKLVLFGFSQGVSTISRMAAYKKWPFYRMILWAGSFPKELTKDEFSHLPHTAKVVSCIGRQDIYYSEQLVVQEKVRLSSVFTGRLKMLTFEGKHEVVKEELTRLVSGF